MDICGISMLDKIYTNLDTGMPHFILIKKLESISLTDFSLKWFRSYLRGRIQVTKVAGKGSDNLTIKTGVLQGSIFGPVFVNDLDRLGNLTSCLVPILVNRLGFYINKGLLPLTVSDHLPVFCFCKRDTKVNDCIRFFHASLCRQSYH